MSFWDDKLGPSKAAQPPPAAAPGAWWQTQQQREQLHPHQELHRGPTGYGHNPHQGTERYNGEYAPKSSGFVKTRTSDEVDDTCPRCGSYDYIKIAAEPASGSSYRLPSASMRCMVCNFPALDTSEGVIGSVNGTAAAVPVNGSTDVTTYKVRERGGKNQNAFAGFNESSQAEGSHVVRIM